MNKCYCDICKKEILKSDKRYTLFIRERCLPKNAPETQLFLEDVCYSCCTDIEKYIKNGGFNNE